MAGGELPSTGPPDQITDSMITYDPTTMTWTPVTSMPTKRTRFRLVAARGQLYAIGGFSEADQPLATVERYDPGSHSWDTVASMHQTRVLPGAVVIRSGQRRFIVVVGGGGGQPGTPAFRRLRTTEVYNVDTDRWHRLQVLLPHGKISLVSEVEDDRTVLAIRGRRCRQWEWCSLRLGRGPGPDRPRPWRALSRHTTSPASAGARRLPPAAPDKRAPPG